MKMKCKVRVEYELFFKVGIIITVLAFNSYSLLPVLCSADFLMVDTAVLVIIYNTF